VIAVRRAATLALLLLGALTGAAGAATLLGTSGSDRLLGTPGADRILGRAGDDRLDGAGGADFLDGGPGRDVLLGGGGADLLAAEADGAVDTVSCGAGRDIVSAELADRVAGDCEVVSRQLSRDTTQARGAQHATEVEPDSFAVGSAIVTAFQVGRYADGGAVTTGFATSRDGGRRWIAGLLPGLTVDSRPAGAAERVSDPVVAYDAAHGTWLVASLGVGDGETTILVSRSREGLRWDAPVGAAATRSPMLAYDKEWIACDNGAGSPFRGRCYLAYTDLVQDGVAVQSSDDGGLSWSAPVLAHPEPDATGVQPVSLPDGALVLAFLETDGIAAVRSADGGASFGPLVEVADLREAPARGLRSPPLPSIDVARDGTLLVVWHDCRFRAGCSGNDIVLSTSRAGETWTAPRRLPLDRRAGHVIPGLAADPSSGRVAVLFHSLPEPDCAAAACRVTVGIVESPNGGRGWGRPQRLATQAMPLAWMPRTSLGRMLGDYVSVSYVGGRAVPVFALASEPGAGGLRQAIFATVVRKGR